MIRSYREIQGAGLNARQRAMFGLGFSFNTWRTPTLDGGLGQAAAVGAMMQANETVGGG